MNLMLPSGTVLALILTFRGIIVDLWIYPHIGSALVDFKFFKKINIGCGHNKLDGYLNIDIDEAAAPDVLVVDNDLSFLPQGHFDEVLANDVLEHIPHRYTMSALLDWASLLRHNGILRIQTSNVLGVMQQMHKNPKFDAEYNWMRCLFGNQQHLGDYHYYGFTPRTLQVYLQVAGFACDGFEVRDLWLLYCEAEKVTDWKASLSLDLSDEAFVEHAYQTTLRRPADTHGLVWHCEALKRGQPREVVLRQLLTSPETMYVAGAALPQLPNDDGFFALEPTEQGPVRWTGQHARKRLRVYGGRAFIAVSTNRPSARESVNHVFILTAWQTLKVPLLPGAWREVEITIPAGADLDTVTVEIVTLEHWYPAKEIGSTDQRCLGVIVREDDTPQGTIWDGDVPINATEKARLDIFRFESRLAMQRL